VFSGFATNFISPRSHVRACVVRHRIGFIPRRAQDGSKAF
jgi:hypothetical protein